MPNYLKKAAQYAKKGLDVASDIAGTTTVVKVGSNLAKNVKNVVQGKTQEYLYKPGAKVSELVKDVSGIATAGSLAVGAVAGLGAKKVVAKAAQSPAGDGISAARKALMTSEQKAGHAFKAFQRAARGLKY